MQSAVRVGAAAAAVLVLGSVTGLSAMAAGVAGGDALELTGIVAGVLIFAASFWVRQEQASPTITSGVPQGDALLSSGSDPVPTQIVVGDIPAQAVAWQERSGLLDRLHTRASAERLAVVAAVTGQRGVGKSQVAARYARQRVAEGWPLVAWMNAETEVGLLTGLDHLANAAGIRQPNADLADTVKHVVAWLRTHPGPCLLVFDNATDPDLLRRFTPSLGHVQVIVTTTDRRFEGVGGVIEVDMFTAPEAIAYLRERTQLTDDIGAAELAEQLGWLPVAVAQAGAVIGPGRRYRSYQAYRAAFGRVPVGKLLPRHAGQTYPLGAAEAILISLDDLATAEHGGAARQLLDALAVLAPVGADATLVTVLVEGLDDRDKTDADALVEVLALRSLTMPTRDGDRTVVHRLIHRVAYERIQQTGRLDDIVTACADAVEAAARKAATPWDKRAMLNDYIEHTQVLWEKPVMEAGRRRLLDLRGWLLHLLNQVHNNAVAIIVGPRVATDSEQVLGPDHPSTLVARNNLASAYRRAGRLDEAIDLFTRNLADFERVLGPDHPDTLSSRNNLANAYQEVGRLNEAIDLGTRAVADYTRVLGPDHPHTLIARSNLGYTYVQIARLDEAIDLYTRNLADFERVRGPDHPEVLIARNSLGYAYRRAGRLDEAIDLFTQTLADREQVLGPDHPDTLGSRNNLAGAYQQAGRLDEAIDLFTQTLADYSRVLGPDQPNTLNSRNNLASAYQQAGRLNEAIDLFTQTLADLERVLGPDHPNTLTSRNNLAYSYRRAGRLDEAIRLYTRTLADRERVLGPDHPDTLTSRNNLASVHQAVVQSINPPEPDSD
jgi:tetratricopeptide (TPR) repeat protein